VGEKPGRLARHAATLPDPPAAAGCFTIGGAGEPSPLMTPSHDSAAEMFVTVRFSDGHKHRWRLPATQTADEALEELRQVITGGQWFRIPGHARAYSPYSIVTVEVAAGEPGESEDSFARRLGEAVGEVVSPDS
jgi:hypothetical protein